MWLPKTCCCGCTLEKGSKIIGQIGVAFAFLSLLRSFKGLSGGIDALSAAGFVVNFIKLGVSILLITAVQGKKHNHLLIWIISQIFLTLISLGAEGYLLYTAIEMEDTFLISIVAPLVVLDTLLQLYSMLIVYSFYKQLTSPRDARDYRNDEEKAVPLTVA